MNAKNTLSNSLISAINYCVENNLTFAAYRMPQADDKNLLIQSSSNLQSVNIKKSILEQKGFLIAPFSKDTKHETFLIKADYIFKNKLTANEFDQIKTIFTELTTTHDNNIPRLIKQNEYLNNITEIVKTIKSGQLSKAVLSRVKLIEGNYCTKIGAIFELLCKKYKNVFVYAVQFNGQIWLGATPEPFAIVKDGIFQTSSVAATRNYSSENTDVLNWNTKEQYEQKNVTQYIEKVFKDLNIQNFKKTEPFVRKAGNLMHLSTDFSIPYQTAKPILEKLISKLHPTSAVCGTPKDEALSLIEKYETHEREYYTGYLGTVGIENPLSLYVNLRCMKVLKNHLSLFVGGGITADSIPQDEWSETEIKANTLLKVIRLL